MSFSDIRDPQPPAPAKLYQNRPEIDRYLARATADGESRSRRLLCMIRRMRP